MAAVDRRLHYCSGLAVLAIAALLGAAAAHAGAGRSAAAASCRPLRLTSSYAARVGRATRAGPDLWGNDLIRDGPSYQGAGRFLEPLLLGRGPLQAGPLTDSGVYYLPFGEPDGIDGRGPIALHVADGSEIVSDRFDGPRLTLAVGGDGTERFGSCLSRLSTPRLLGGYYPILDTEYVDANGVRFRQESFAARLPRSGTIASFVRLDVDVPAGTTERVRLTPSEPGLQEIGARLVRGADTVLFFGAGGRFAGSSLEYDLGPGPRTIFVVRPVRPAPAGPLDLDERTYEHARRSVTSYWDGRLSAGATFVVPERRVLDAERNLLIQNLLMTWRYSLGNAYETFEFPESLENAGVLGEYGFAAADRAIVEESFRREPHLYPNWEAATRLLAAARYFRLFADRAFVAAATPALQRNAALLEAQHGLLRKERYTADLPDVAYGLQTQAVAWQGLGGIAGAWAATGRGDLAAASRLAAARLHASLRVAVTASERRLPDGSLFLPARLLDDEHPYEAITASRHGSYWNLVVQDALASGFFPPRGPEADGALAYMLAHGSRLLGLVRGDAASLYHGRVPGASGTDEVYGLNVARFLADNDRPDQLALSLYGALAAGMTDGTFVSGESATVTPLPGDYYRSMYLPPNSTSNAAFLECLRLMLVHETPNGLQLAFATPRAWLAPGKRIIVRRAPTSFGPVSFSLDSGANSVRVGLRLPRRAPMRSLSLELRRPGRQRIARVELDGRAYRRFDPAAETIDLTGLTGTMTLVVRFGTA